MNEKFLNQIHFDCEIGHFRIKWIIDQNYMKKKEKNRAFEVFLEVLSLIHHQQNTNGVRKIMVFFLSFVCT